MSGEVVNFPRKKGNGAREAVVEWTGRILRDYDELLMTDSVSLANNLLAFLWSEGFKVVPLEPEDAA